MTEIVLDRGDLLHAVPVGAMRKALHKLADARGEKLGARTAQRYRSSDEDPWAEVESAVAEYCVAKTLARFWPGDFWTRHKTIDIPPDIEVRWTGYENGHLLLFDDDPPDYKYVLVTGCIPRFKIRGWIVGSEGMQQDYWKQMRADRPPLFAVPIEKLHDLHGLILT